MSDEPHIISRDDGIPNATSERLLLTPNEMDEKTDRQLRGLIKGLIDSVETGIHDGAEKVAVIATAQYYVQELARRSQSRQTCWIIAMTGLITFMTLVITVEALWPHCLRSGVHSLLIHASQVLDLWWPHH